LTVDASNSYDQDGGNFFIFINLNFDLITERLLT